MSARSLCLDLDGTLADSLPALRRAYARVVAGYGGAPSEDEFSTLDGVAFGELVESVRRTHAPREASGAFALRYRAAVDAEHAASPPRAGARELLGAAAARAIPVAVVTSGPEALARRWLVAHELAARIALVIGSESSARGKPAPDPYLAALERLACGAEDSLAVEDSRLGAESALAAGIATYVIAAPAKYAAFPPGCRFVSGLDELCTRL